MNDPLGPGDGTGNPGDGSGGDPGAGNGGGDKPLLSDWRKSLAGEVATSPALEKFNGKEFSDVVSAYINLEKKLGGNPIVRPGKEATPEQLAEYYNQLGRPEDPTGYTLGPPEDLPEGFPYDAEEETAFRKWAHEQGLSDEHAKAFWDRRISGAATAFKSAGEKRQAGMAKAWADLRQEWGEAYDGKLQMANQVLRLGGADFVEFLKSRGLQQETAVVKFMAALGSKMGEDTLGQGRPKPGIKLTPEEAQSRINKIMGDPEHAYWNPDPQNPAKVEAMKQMADLHELAYPNQEPSGGTLEATVRANM